MTYGQFEDCLEGYSDRVEDEMRLHDRLNHILGSYIATGVNNPKKYPTKPLLERAKKPASIQTARQMAMMLGATING